MTGNTWAVVEVETEVAVAPPMDGEEEDDVCWLMTSDEIDEFLLCCRLEWSCCDADTGDGDADGGCGAFLTGIRLVTVIFSLLSINIALRNSFSCSKISRCVSSVTKLYSAAFS